MVVQLANEKKQTERHQALFLIMREVLTQAIW